MRIGEIYDCGNNWFKITKIEDNKHFIQRGDCALEGLIYKDEFKDYIETHQMTKRAGFKEYLIEIER